MSFLSVLSSRDVSSQGSGSQTAFYFQLSQTYGVAAAQILFSSAPQIHSLFYPLLLTKLPRGHRSLAPSELAGRLGKWQSPICLTFTSHPLKCDTKYLRVCGAHIQIRKIGSESSVMKSSAVKQISATLQCIPGSVSKSHYHRGYGVKYNC